MSEWYYANGEQQQGPVTREELAYMISSGQLPPETLVWTSSMTEWKPGTQAEGLFTPVVPGTPPAESCDPAFLYISVTRLILLSIFSCGLYEAYWIYKNWRYLKNREGLSIMPFWRGVFGIFHCHRLLEAISLDEELGAVEASDFAASSLATGWVLLTIVSNLVSRFDDPWVSLLSYVIPSFLCLVPVQKYINRVNAKRCPNAPHASRWSAGHIVCILFGCFIWGVSLLTLLVETVSPEL